MKQRLDSRRATEIGTAEECRKAKTDDILCQLQHLPIGGAQFVELHDRQSKRIWMMFIFLTSWPPLLLAANLNGTVRAALGAVVSNVAAVILSALVSAVTPRLWQRIKKI